MTLYAFFIVSLMLGGDVDASTTMEECEASRAEVVAALPEHRAKTGDTIGVSACQAIEVKGRAGSALGMK